MHAQDHHISNEYSVVLIANDSSAKIFMWYDYSTDLYYHFQAISIHDVHCNWILQWHWICELSVREECHLSCSINYFLGVTFRNIVCHGNYRKYDNVDAWCKSLMRMRIPSLPISLMC